ACSFRGPGAVAIYDSFDRINDAFGSGTQQLQLMQRLPRAQALHWIGCVLELHTGKVRLKHEHGVSGDERRIDAYPSAAPVEAAEMAERKLRGLCSRPGRRFDVW